MSHSRIPLHASVLFTPFELSIYERWRSLHFVEVNVFGIATVPTAFEYADYQQWRAEERAKKPPQQKSPAHNIFQTNENLKQETTDFVLAGKCKHALHPAHPSTSPHEEGQIKEPIPWCPTCTLKHHNALISTLYTNWTDLGGPWRDAALANEEERNTYADTNRAYQKARVALVNTMATFESIAEDEKNWNLAHLDRDVDAVMPYSATKALEQYHKNLTFPAQFESSGQVALGPQTPITKRLKAAKKFQYSPDTPESTKNRPQTFWARNLTSHDPDSPHVCPDPEGYEDTSYYSNWHFSVSQCRILLCFYPSPTSLSLRYRHLNATFSPNFGIDNSAVHRLIAILDAHIAKEPPEQQAVWYQYLKTTSDVFLVWNGETMKDNEQDLFTHFERTPGLMGSHIETYARIMGDIDDEEWVAAKGSLEVPEDEDEDSYDQESLASEDEDEAVDIELADAMDLEEED